LRQIIKNITCISLSLILFLHINFIGLYYSLYSINKKELVESVCEKKNDSCEAKCFLEKKINEENDADAKSNTPVKEMKLKVSEFIVSGVTLLYSPINISDQLINNSQKYSSGYPQLKFDPPKS